MKMAIKVLTLSMCATGEKVSLKSIILEKHDHGEINKTNVEIKH